MSEPTYENGRLASFEQIVEYVGEDEDFCALDIHTKHSVSDPFTEVARIEQELGQPLALSTTVIRAL